MPNKPKVILGIDPGYERVGIAIVEKISNSKEVLLYSDCFRTSANLDINKRLQLIGQEIKRVIGKYNPDTLAIESLFLAKNQKTAMSVSEAKGIIIYEAVNQGLEVKEYSPMQIKTSIASDGTSDKKRIIKMIHLLIKLEENGRLDDEYDAIAVALTHCAHLRA